jgi:hypothetical protein
MPAQIFARVSGPLQMEKTMSRSITLIILPLFACEVYSQDEQKKNPVGLIIDRARLE